MISGTIGYIKLKNNEYEYLFFLDNHLDETYCLKNKIFLHEVFDKLYPINSYNLFIEEPIIDTHLELEFKSEHVLKYLEYIKNKNVIKFDIRYCNLGISEMINILEKFIKDKKNLPKMLSTHLMKIKKLFIKLQKGGKYIDIYKPFINSQTVSEESILDSLMEFYLILMLLTVNKKNNIIYSGAIHCIIISRLLSKFYGFQIIKDVNMNLNDKLNLEDFDKFPNCTNLSDLIK